MILKLHFFLHSVQIYWALMRGGHIYPPPNILKTPEASEVCRCFFYRLLSFTPSIWTMKVLFPDISLCLIYILMSKPAPSGGSLSLMLQQQASNRKTRMKPTETPLMAKKPFEAPPDRLQGAARTGTVQDEDNDTLGNIGFNRREINYRDDSSSTQRSLFNSRKQSSVLFCHFLVRLIVPKTYMPVQLLCFLMQRCPWIMPCIFM